jgi:2-succinyl-6-hydroxy-2,4-cyclohexadiene-1-carboxylate synthase
VERVNLFLLHGFLGRPSDWTGVTDQLARYEGVRFFIPDYFNDPSLDPRNLFAPWAKNFTRWVEEQGCAGERNVLVGYSLGGRLALHALEKNSTLWDQVILISTNAGFDDSLAGLSPDSEAREQRWVNDSHWAEEFSKSSWASVLKNWNGQSVFEGGQQEPVRIEREYSREMLSLALTNWSLAQQRNMRPVIRQHLEKVKWVVGERDNKYVQMSRRLVQEIPGLAVDMIPGASHRVLFDRPEALGRRLKELLRQ